MAMRPILSLLPQCSETPQTNKRQEVTRRQRRPLVFMRRSVIFFGTPRLSVKFVQQFADFEWIIGAQNLLRDRGNLGQAGGEHALLDGGHLR